VESATPRRSRRTVRLPDLERAESWRAFLGHYLASDTRSAVDTFLVGLSKLGPRPIA